MGHLVGYLVGHLLGYIVGYIVGSSRVLVIPMIKLVDRRPNTTGPFTGVLYGGLVKGNIRLHVPLTSIKCTRAWRE